MARIEVEERSLIVESDALDQLWQSRLEIPISHVVSATVSRDAANWRTWLQIGHARVSDLTTAGAFLHHGRDVYCDVRDGSRVVVITLRDERYDRLVVGVDDPAAAVDLIEQALRWQQLPANMLAFLLGVLEAQAPVAAVVNSIWESGQLRGTVAAVPSPREIACAVLGEAAFEGALDAGRAAYQALLIDSERPAASRFPQARHGESGYAYRGGPRLSGREQEVFGLLAEGCSNQGIAEALSISERTARYHVTSIFNKLGADNRAHAVAIGAQRGLLA